MTKQPNKFKLLQKSRSQWKSPDNPIISFPIATYNRPEILFNRTIPSILDQNYSNIEVVIIGDHVNDLDRYYQFYRLYQDDKRVRFYDLRKRTVYPSDPVSFWCIAGYKPRNIAARISCGDYHWWISDDDILEKNSIKNLLEHIILNEDAECIFGDRGIYDKNGNLELYTLKSKPTNIISMTGMPSLIVRSYLSNLFPGTNIRVETLLINQMTMIARK